MSLVWSSLTKIISIRYNKWCHSFVLICTIPKYPVVTYPRLQSSCCEDFQIKSDCLCKNNTAHVLHPWQALVVIWPASRKWLGCIWNSLRFPEMRSLIPLQPLFTRKSSDQPSALQKSRNDLYADVHYKPHLYIAIGSIRTWWCLLRSNGLTGLVQSPHRETKCTPCGIFILWSF